MTRTPAQRAMALMCTVSAVAALLSSSFPLTDASPVALARVAGALAVLLGLVVWTVPHRAVLHLGVLAHTVGLAVLVATSVTGAGASAVAVGNVWVGLYAACFLGTTATRVHCGLLAGALAAGLAAHPFQGALHVGLLVGTTLLVAPQLVAGLVERLERAAVTDPLTGLLNRQGLVQAAAVALLEARRTAEPLTVVVVDLDGFKLVNDRHGHAAGDALLVELAGRWRSGVRPGDVVARVGGDEFVLLLPGTTAEEAAGLVARLRRTSPALWSSGTSTAVPADDLDAVLLRADRDLYRSKQARSSRLPAPRPDAPAHPEVVRLA